MEHGPEDEEISQPEKATPKSVWVGAGVSAFLAHEK